MDNQLTGTTPGNPSPECKRQHKFQDHLLRGFPWPAFFALVLAFILAWGLLGHLKHRISVELKHADIVSKY